MKYAVVTTGNTVQSAIAKQFGHAPFVVIFDAVEDQLQFIENPYAFQQQQSGRQLIELLVEKGVQTIVSASFGPKIMPLISAKALQLIVFDKPGAKVEDIIHLIKTKNT